MLDSEPFTFRVTDLKQHVYCPRILYYHTVLPAVRPVTYKMEAGLEAHSAAEGRERRRSLRTYGLAEGTRYFNVALYSAELGLSGELDMLIETEEELIPVDYKAAAREGQHFRLQLMAYGRLLEVAWAGRGKPVRRGFLYYLPGRKAVEVHFSSALRRQLALALIQMKRVAQEQLFPPPAKQLSRCVDCEFRRFCNDVL
ncbi:MAG: CRISPR-associated protein Cas4 [Chloroflexi bacterium]|nr:CRISPR-associated protein Cas4 [Chloroflexota bacterium]